MAVKLSSVRADIDREHEGDWVESGILPGVRFKVRAFTYPPYQVARQLAQQKLNRIHGTKKPAPGDKVHAAFGELYAKHILLDWDGFVDDDGVTPIVYSAELAREYLTDIAWRQFSAAVEDAAHQLADIQIEFAETAEKNSGPPSAGS